MQPTPTRQAVILGPVALLVLCCLVPSVEGKWTYNHGDANFVSAIRTIIKAQLTPAIAEVAKTKQITKLDNEACRLAATTLGNLFKIVVFERYDQARTILLEYVFKQVMKEHDGSSEGRLSEMNRELVKRSVYLWTIIEHCATIPPQANVIDYRSDYSTNETERDKIADVLMHLYPKSKVEPSGHDVKS